MDVSDSLVSISSVRSIVYLNILYISNAYFHIFLSINFDAMHSIQMYYNNRNVSLTMSIAMAMPMQICRLQRVHALKLQSPKWNKRDVTNDYQSVPNWITASNAHEFYAPLKIMPSILSFVILEKRFAGIRGGLTLNHLIVKLVKYSFKRKKTKGERAMCGW